MNREVCETWAEALVSGDYEQGVGGLRQRPTDTYCCLGVLCDLAVKAGVIPEPSPGDHEWWYHEPGENIPALCKGEGCTGGCTVALNSSICFLPRAVVEWAGLDAIDPVLKGRAASCWNDSARSSFEFIAGLIHEELGDES